MSAEDPLSLLQPAATKVRDPVTGNSVWLAGMIQKPRIEEGKLRFDLVFKQEHAREDRRAIEQAIMANLRGLGFEGEAIAFPRLAGSAPGERPSLAKAPPTPPKAKDAVPGMSGPGVMPHGGPISKKPIPGVRKLIVVASGKGGVGKSTVSTNLAVAMRRVGYRVGLLDADVYGPSLPKMMNTTQKPMVSDNKLIPVMSYGVRCLSMGLLVPEEEAMIWRGPMVMGVVRQFLQDANWGELDYLIVDLPPGTGDVQLTLIQATDIHGAVIVTTPQDVALADAIRGVTMFQKLEVPLLGVVENMSYYELPDGTRDHVFGEGGGARIAERFGTELLAELPLQTATRRGGDQGLPAALGSDASADRFMKLAKRIAEKLPAGD